MRGLWGAVGAMRRTVLAVLVVAGVLGAAVTALHAVDPDTHPRAVRDSDARLAACALFASPSGSDTAGRGTAGKPFRSPQRLLRALAPGATGCLRAGRYTGDVRMRRDGTTLRSAPGERALLTMSTLEVPRGVDGVTVSHLDLVGGGGALTVRLVGDRFVLSRNDITNERRGASCVLVGASDHRTLGGRILDNVIHGCGRQGNHLDHGIYAQNVGPPAATGATGLLVQGNVIYDVASYAVQLYPEALDAVVRANVIDGGGRSVRGGVVIDGEVSANHRIEGNAIARTRTGAVIQRTGTGHVSRSNCLWGNARGVAGPAIRSSGDRTGDSCWLSPQLWAATGAMAADEPCVCPERVAARCSAARTDALCRLLKSSKEES